MQHVADTGRAARLRALERLDDLDLLVQAGARRDLVADFLVEEHEPGRVALADHEVPERRRAPARVVELRPAERAERHRLARVDQQVTAEVRLRDELLHDQPIAAREDLPVERAELVAGHVLAVLRELDRAALLR